MLIAAIRQPVSQQWATLVFYAVLCALCSSMKVRLPSISGTISVGFLFVLLGIRQMTSLEVILIAVTGGIWQMYWHAEARPRPVQVIFNLAALIISSWVAHRTYSTPWFAGQYYADLFRLGIASGLYFAANTGIVSTVIALVEKRPLLSVWKGHYSWAFGYYILGASLAEMVHVSAERLGWALALTLAPLIYGIHRSYRMYVDGLESEKAHAHEMADLHVRTIEALALSIEAKDECTSEHLRRVQTYSLAIGEELGLGDEEIKALRAAAILHDIGKLAVPDYIISKPGKLTRAEFEKMKIHPAVGAEILEQVNFPYPVAPIVRAHHEKWDGTGYPAGLKGEEIPIGARILGAVDCFDALASHRQYRPALSLEEAMAYVVSRAGTEFDPRVVEVLARNYHAFEQRNQAAPLRQQLLSKDKTVELGDAPAAGFEQSRAGSTGESFSGLNIYQTIATARYQMQAIQGIACEMGNSLGFSGLMPILSAGLKTMAPHNCIAFYVREDNLLKPKFVQGDNAELFQSLEIPIGEGLSGWVLDNNKPILNGNPAVEPGYLADPSKFSTLRSALAIPLVSGDSFQGVLALYAADQDAFCKQHLRVLFSVRRMVSGIVRLALDLPLEPAAVEVDGLTGLATALAFHRRLEQDLESGQATGSRLAVLLCDLDGMKWISDHLGQMTRAELTRSFGDTLRRQCQDAYLAARLSGDQFGLLLPGSDPASMQERIEAIAGMVRSNCASESQQEVIEFRAGWALYPDDGEYAETLVEAAEGRMAPVAGGEHATRWSGRALTHLDRNLREADLPSPSNISSPRQP
jgi:diguanylate cyclase (GGDEF)-like protein/putative nucleotidyltransferase with HDIG domain